MPAKPSNIPTREPRKKTQETFANLRPFPHPAAELVIVPPPEIQKPRIPESRNPGIPVEQNPGFRNPGNPESQDSRIPEIQKPRIPESRKKPARKHKLSLDIQEKHWKKLQRFALKNDWFLSESVEYAIDLLESRNPGIPGSAYNEHDLDHDDLIETESDHQRGKNSQINQNREPRAADLSRPFPPSSALVPAIVRERFTRITGNPWRPFDTENWERLDEEGRQTVPDRMQEWALNSKKPVVWFKYFVESWLNERKERQQQAAVGIAEALATTAEARAEMDEPTQEDLIWRWCLAHDIPWDAKEYQQQRGSVASRTLAQ